MTSDLANLTDDELVDAVAACWLAVNDPEVWDATDRPHLAALLDSFRWRYTHRPNPTETPR